MRCPNGTISNHFDAPTCRLVLFELFIVCFFMRVFLAICAV
jgi:hypothetical protein